MEWYYETHDEESTDEMVPTTFSYENLWERVKNRFKNFLELRRERMLTRLGITGTERVREYSVDAGGAREEVGIFLRTVIIFAYCFPSIIYLSMLLFQFALVLLPPCLCNIKSKYSE